MLFDSSDNVAEIGKPSTEFGHESGWCNVQVTEVTVSTGRRCRRTHTKRLNMPVNPTGLQSDMPVCCCSFWRGFCFYRRLSVVGLSVGLSVCLLNDCDSLFRSF